MSKFSRTNIVEIQFSDGTFYRVETHYKATALELARKLIRTRGPAENPYGYVKGVGVFAGDRLDKWFGNFNTELSR